MNIDDMSLFVEVVKAKGFTQAANNLNIPISTISVRVNRLEQQLGLRLLNRTTRRIELTDIGRIYYERALHIVEESKALHHQLGDLLNNPTGVLRLSLPVDFAYEILSPLLPEFYQRYPLIQLELDVTPRKVDLISEAFDLVIRIGDQVNSSLISRKLLDLSVGLYATKDYLVQHGIPKTPQDLMKHHCLQMHYGHQQTWQLFNGKQEKLVEVKGDFLSNSLGMNLRLAVSGVGIVKLPDIIAKNALSSGQLQRVLPEWQGKSISAYALTTTRLQPAKTQVFIQFLKEKFGE